MQLEKRLLACLALSIAATGAGAHAAGSAPFLNKFNTIKSLASTVPGNGDVNPYGVAVIGTSTGKLVKGNILVSNFNDAANQQGTGTTIVEVSPDGHTTQFAFIDANALPGTCPGGVGLTTALAVLQRGWVIVGSLPTTDGTSATAQAGCLIVLNSNGQVAEVFSGNGIDGPWDMTDLDLGGAAILFVTNVLNGDATTGAPHVVKQGTVLRITLAVPQQGQGKPQRVATATIGSGFPESADPNALVIGPTGVGLAPNGTLYVADTLGNRVAAIPNALTRLGSAQTGATVSAGGALNGPLGLTIAPGGDVITANAGDGNLVETTPAGKQVAVKTVDTATGAGSLFGLAITPQYNGVYFVDDGDNTLKLLTSSYE
ncbi:MAG: hypothetical protein P4L83_13230 [Nevskia sp.]|nr:hypothetical protein [Nevskia sp.]